MREGALPASEAVDIALRVAEGLAFAHEHGIVHRDVKPGNIMLLERGPVKIMDFGIARMRHADHKTSAGMVLGTPRYMSPEQIGGLPVDQRSDIFSLGVVLHEMLTGATPFAGDDITQLVYRSSTGPRHPPWQPHVPPMLDYIVARALKKNPAVRYGSAAEMCADLRDAIPDVLEAEVAARLRAAATGDGIMPGSCRHAAGAPGDALARAWRPGRGTAPVAALRLRRGPRAVGRA